MAVGKNSIQRVQKASKEIKPEAAQTQPETKASSVKVPADTKQAAEKTTKSTTKSATKSTTKAATKTVKKVADKTVKKVDLHEEKFEMISGIYTTLPDYLL